MAEQRAPEPTSDDAVLPFQVEGFDVRGRVVQLGPALDAILARHAYPNAVSRLLAEAVTLTALLGASLKFEGRFILQTQTDGPVHMLVVDFATPDRLRAYAGFDRDAVEAAQARGEATPERLLGAGHLAMTIDQGPDTSRYQGVVRLEAGSLESAAHDYFRQSEQIPTRVRLAAAEMLTRTKGAGARHSWRAGGLLVQFLPSAPERARQQDLPPGDAPEGAATPDIPEDDAWVEVKSLVDTIEDHELTDPDVAPERLLFRLFHERGVRVFEPQPVQEKCRCSRERIDAMLRQFSAEDRADMTEGAAIVVTCEFCGTRYPFAASEFPQAPQ